MSYSDATRARVYLRESAEFRGEPTYRLIVQAFRRAGITDLSVHRGIMGFDRASGVLSSRPLRFHADLPLVVEAVGDREQVESALPEIRSCLSRGLITLSDVQLYVSD
ncbi:hypothetical protein RradSPS_2563 [Rubrobacter radiotolerans]|uniref:DUF190 domain-containing protein n=1 Tax=Rubrobacter radiotolerans TaxID=42256 RepID=A0A023X6J3_RUBRA|nr:DUF190 domain-containing protein [Rubrobacter radiotolerans]AHY47846.1 hypothetical protein RradSPS_2563 [Rubrobacter radiotolerans]MDX5892485.1 DUF190 domain-containing protein [Rubrobacter radiotolerans]SMC07776.1 hypothetical protein SAMN00767673_2636 [Rubrobacter radiotolerans DSM 5868]